MNTNNEDSLWPPPGATPDEALAHFAARLKANDEEHRRNLARLDRWTRLAYLLVWGAAALGLAPELGVLAGQLWGSCAH